MSSRSRRGAILEAARDLIEREGFERISLERVARAAGVTRQAVYLHFDSKAGLLLALVDHADRSEGLAEALRPIEEARNAVEAIDGFAAFAGEYAPPIHAIAMALEAARRSDPAVEEAWQNRMRMRRRLHRQLIGRLEREGSLADRWSVREAADFVWALTLPQMYDSLVEERRWSRKGYAALLSRVLRDTLVKPSKRR